MRTCNFSYFSTFHWLGSYIKTFGYLEMTNSKYGWLSIGMCLSVFHFSIISCWIFFPVGYYPIIFCTESTDTFFSFFESDSLTISQQYSTLIVIMVIWFTVGKFSSFFIFNFNCFSMFFFFFFIAITMLG